ncbi:DUF3089 domain-containing protein [Novosphingobium sp. TCA1]|uniref:DUF3089 domain-containing protein n=1 Tax=Novosphingobium pentaromativorans TaxID=205844 RepID=A0A2W5NMT8_9SPHN|nr:DUF3089 domain-containing protein [Novosphingobium sp. TCA1]PZQ54792.1 MAG: hypothetical protein DI555_12300 [Novosphingobium pentaromativorans]GFE75560.1 hypothetical protein NTCA1_32090 [Novosphingobium sp. TCA1]
MARKFLYVIAIVVLLVIGLLVALRLWSEDLTELAFVPNVEYAQKDALGPEAWRDAKMWLARPDMPDDPSRWLPPGVEAPKSRLKVAVFFVHPTSLVARSAWNGDVTDAFSQDRAALFVKGMASPFNRAEIWAPRYRQAAIGAFLTAAPEANRAIDLAYSDVLAAFDQFVKSVPRGRPIVVAGHSQGAFLLRRVLRDRVADKPLARRVIAAYVIGWPVSLAHDLPKMGLPACAGAEQTGCVVSWLSVADPADTKMLLAAYGRRTGLDGQGVAASPFLCTNPLTGSEGGSADAAANLGTLVPQFRADSRAASGTLAMATVPATCGPDHFLHIGPPPALDMGPYVLPGNNYHLYDVTLFWANLRADFERRVATWQKAQ